MTTPSFTPASAPTQDVHDLVGLVAELERRWSRTDGSWKIVAGQNTAVIAQQVA